MKKKCNIILTIFGILIAIAIIVNSSTNMLGNKDDTINLNFILLAILGAISCIKKDINKV